MSRELALGDDMTCSQAQAEASWNCSSLTGHVRPKKLPGFVNLDKLAQPSHFWEPSLPHQGAALMFYGAKRQKSSTTSLPAALREELGITSASDVTATGPRPTRGGPSFGRGNGRGGGVLGRKEARKVERKERKGGRSRPIPSNNNDAGTKGNYQRSSYKSATSTAPQQLPKPNTNRSDLKGKAKEVSKRRLSKEEAVKLKPIVSKTQRKHVGGEEMTPLQRLSMRGESSRKEEEADTSTKKRKRVPLSAVERDEEDEIAWLEAHIGKQQVAKQKREEKKARGDGEGESVDGIGDDLDDLLDDLDRFYPGMYDHSGDEEESEEESDDSEEGSTETSDEEEIISDLDSDDSNDDLSDGAGEGENEDVIWPGSSTSTSAVIAATPAVDDIGSSGRYVPPALRKKLAEGGESEETQKLKRQAKGLLNRLGEGNIDAITNEIVDTLYRQYNRATVTETLTTLIIQTVTVTSDLVETFVILQAAVVASLHRLIGVEFGAHFLQTIVETWINMYEEEGEGRNIQKASEVEETNKGLKNVIALIANLYNLGVVACPLIFDIVKLFLGQADSSQPQGRKMTEIDVELLLKVMKTSGQQLRRDDSTSLKTIVMLAQQSSVSGDVQSLSSRSRFMLEALEDLKSAKAKASAANSLEQQSVSRMKKYLSGLTRKKIVRTHEPLRIGLKDLRDAEKRGKWWLVGAAWAGYDFDKTESGIKTDALEGNRLDGTMQSDGKEGEETQVQAKREALIAMARQHGMNTAIRQDIFIILVSSDDYLDALEKLQSLKFKKASQRREIIRVLLHCIGSEAMYNPYYVVLASRLALDDMGTRITLQYCLWDFLRELGERNAGGRSIVEREDDEEDGDTEDSFNEAVSPHRIANTARAYGWWFAKEALSLSSIRVIDFTSLKERAVTFLQQLFVHLCLSVQTSSPALTLSLPESNKGSGVDRYMAMTSKSKTIDEASKRALEAVFVKGTLSNPTLAQGLLFFFERHLSKKDCIAVAVSMGTSRRAKEQLLWARGVVKHILKVGATAGGPTDSIDFVD